MAAECALLAYVLHSEAIAQARDCVLPRGQVACDGHVRKKLPAHASMQLHAHRLCEPVKAFLGTVHACSCASSLVPGVRLQQLQPDPGEQPDRTLHQAVLGCQGAGRRPGG